ncbi:MAG: EAL domain-containing protein [Acidimicrobiales bacterium]
MTSKPLPSEAPVQSKMFPKTRSWLALGAPLELMSPLSILRVIYVLAVVLWAIEDAVLAWAPARIWWLVAMAVTATAVWVGLRMAKELSPRLCRGLAAVGSAFVLLQVYSAQSIAAVVATAVFLVPFATFIALYLGPRTVIFHQLFVSVGLWLALVHETGAGAAAVVAVAATVAMLSASLTVRVLMASVWRSGSVDPDTGLENGVGLAQRLSLDPATPLTRPFVMATVLLAGVDDARQALGYRIGAELLRRAAEDLGQVIPTDAAISRIEGDELVVSFALATGDDPSSCPVVPAQVLAAGRAVAGTLAATINSGHYLVDGIEVSLRAHVGLACAPWNGTDVADLVRRASLSARRAAARGRDDVVWDGDHGTLRADDLALLADLRFSADRHELHLVYQPKVEAATGRAVSVEALLRWDSPVHGSVPPGRFIVLAERTGLVDRLTKWVVAEALDAQARWLALGLELPVAVNLSAKTLGWPDLSDWVMGELDRRELPYWSLILEVTETAAADLEQAVQLLRPLHDRGIRVSIDDFGTGYTSLAAIPHLPLDEIKVDMSFVQRARMSSADEAIVRSVRELAHRLGLVSVAEGVENEVTRALMTDIGFDLLQGYHFSRPLSEAGLVEFVEAQRNRTLTGVGVLAAAELLAK